METFLQPKVTIHNLSYSLWAALIRFPKSSDEGYDWMQSAKATTNANAHHKNNIGSCND